MNETSSIKNDRWFVFLSKINFPLKSNSFRFLISSFPLVETNIVLENEYN